MSKDFFDFLKEYNVINLAIAFVMGAASNTLVKSLVNDIFMPLIDPLLSGISWRDAVLSLGPINLRWGSFLGELLNFLILALVIFIIVKKIIKYDKTEKISNNIIK